jgi:hypothetical protein
MVDFLMNVSAELFAAIIIFVLGFVASRVPRSLERHRFRNFFGKSIPHRTTEAHSKRTCAES